jgi:hypothetical protein
MASRPKTFRVKIGAELWTVVMRRPPDELQGGYSNETRRLYLDPAKLKKSGIEHLVSLVLAVRFRHFMSSAAARDAARVIDRAYGKLLRKKRSKVGK